MPAQLLRSIPSTLSTPPSPSKSTLASPEATKRDAFLAKYRSSPVYRVFFNPDLCDIVLRFLYDPDRPETRVSVARLARTHPKLHHMASRILWGNMDSFVPLLKLIPGFTWRKCRDERGDTRWDVEEADATDSKSSQTVVDTVRFEHHSRYVKNFTWIDRDLTPRTLSFFVDALSSLNKPWLPTVRVFEDLSLNTIPPFALFASPSLQDLWVTASLVKEEALTAMFDELPLRCRNLRHLHVRAPPRWTNERGLGESEAFYPVFTDFLRNGIDGKALMGLRTLRMSVPIVWEDVVSLARLPRLELADVSVYMDPESTADFERLPPGSFPSLTSFRLHLTEFGAAGEHLFDSIESTCLADLSVSISDVAPDATKMRRFYEGLTKSPFSNALTKFSFVISRISELEPSNLGSRTMTSSMSTLRPLLQLRNLRYLTLGLPRVTLSCNDISALASAWPRLKTINIHQMWDGVTPVCVESLSAFSTKCPKLERIGFDVWAGDNKCPNETCGHPVPTTSVTHQGCRVLCADERTYYYTVAYLTLLYPKTSTRELEDEIMQYVGRANAIAAGEGAAGEIVAGEAAAGEVAAGEVAAGAVAANELAVAAGDAQ